MTYVSTAGLSRIPRWTPQQAVLYALGEVKYPDMWYENKCDMFNARCYGYLGSGYVSAINHWNSIPSSLKYRNTSALPGAFVFWNTGTYGHIALCVAPGYVASNDIKRVGRIDVVPISTITNAWGGFLGWSKPYVQAAWGENPNPAPVIPVPKPPTPPKDWFDMATKEELKEAIREVLRDDLAIQNDDDPGDGRGPQISRDTALYRAYSQARLANHKLP